MRRHQFAVQASAAVLVVAIGGRCPAQTPALQGTAAPAPAPAISPATAGAPPPPAVATSDTSSVDEVVVTGTRLQQTGFTTPTPVTVVGASDLQTRGATIIGDVLQEIPAFRPTVSPTQGTGGTFAVGQSTLDLRGLGTTRTLVLLDGRRRTPNQANGTLDTNVIPAGLIDRIDVVTGGASAAYGSDAVAGVVNLILNDRFRGLKTTVQYGLTQRDDNAQFLLSTAAGADFLGDRLHVIVGADYTHSDPSGTEYSRDWGRRETGLVTLPATRAAGLPNYLLSDNAEYAISPAGQIVGCTVGGVARTGAACPLNNLTFTDAGQTMPRTIGSPAGTLQMVGGNYGYNQFRNQYLAVGGERYAALGKVMYDLDSHTQLFAEFSAGRFKVSSQTGDYVNNNGIIVNRDNPFVPAALATQMDALGISQVRLSRLGYSGVRGVSVANVNTTYEGVIGAKGELFDKWKWDVSAVIGNGDLVYHPSGLTLIPNLDAALYVVKGADGNPVCGPVATNPMLATLPAAQRALVSPGCVPLNPFGPSSVSQAAFNYVTPTVYQDTSFDRQDVSANLSGSPFSLPAGPLATAFGLEYRHDAVVVSVDPLTAARSAASAFNAANPTPGRGATHVTEGYFEVGAPILRDLPFIKAFDLNGAVRVTDYSSSGIVSTWKVGGTWDVGDALRLRMTRSRDVRAPNIPELFYRGNDSFAVRANPLTGASSTVNSATLNNPGLSPESADTFTAGFIVKAPWSWAQGFTASLDYYRINLSDVITSISVTDILNRYYLLKQTQYAQYITFDPNSASGFSRVDSPLLNLNRQKTSGVDLDASYHAPANALGVPGRFNFNLVGTYLRQLETYDTTGTSLGDLAGAVPRYRATSNINYQLGDLSTTLTVLYNSSIRYNVTYIGPDSSSYNPALPNSISRNVFPSAIYFALSTEYRFKIGSRSATAYVVVNNLLDKDPPAGTYTMFEGLGSAPSSAFDPYDNLGRAFKFGLRVTL